MKIVSYLLFLVLFNTGFCNDVDFDNINIEKYLKNFPKNYVSLYFGNTFIGYRSSLFIENIDIIPIRIITKINNIKTIEVIDYYALNKMCKLKPKIKHQANIVKYTFDPKININNIQTRIRIPCFNNTVLNFNIIRIDIKITTQKNEITTNSYTIDIRYTENQY